MKISLAGWCDCYSIRPLLLFSGLRLRSRQVNLLNRFEFSVPFKFFPIKLLGSLSIKP